MAATTEYTLLDIVNEMKDKQLIEIGSENGSGFFYIGTVEDLKKNIDEYDKMVKDYANTRIENANSRLTSSINNPPTISEYMETIATAYRQGKDPDLSYEGYEKYLKKYFSSLVSKKKTLDDRFDYYEQLKPLFERKVVDERRSIVDKGAVNVIVEGDEKGRFWDKSEVKSSPLMFMTDQFD